MASNATAAINELPVTVFQKLYEVERRPLGVAILVLFAVTYVSFILSKGPPEAKVPFVGLELGGISKRKKKYVTDANALLKEGYEKFKDGLFQITTTEGNSFQIPTW